MIPRWHRVHWPLVAAALLAMPACNPGGGTSVLQSDQNGQTIAVRVGQEVDIKLGTVGPGQYDSLPELSSGAVRFIDASFVGPAVPAGPRQLFRFAAQRAGVAIITFRHSGMNPTVTDTIAVR